jgi:hypothetical protein
MPGRIERRDAMEALASRATWLEGRDRALLCAWLGGARLSDIAAAAGRNPAVVSRRLCRIARRLMGETFPACRARTDLFSAGELEIIRRALVCGHAVRRIARETGVSAYRVRATLCRAKRLRRPL